VPRALEALLLRTLGAAGAEAVLGDLEEELRSDGRPVVGLRAAWCYWRHGLAIVREARRERRRRETGAGRREVIGGWSALAREIGLAGRALRRQPVFAGTVVLTLALAIGANTALFSVVEGVLLRPLPWDEPDRLVRIYEVDRSQDGRRDFASLPDYHDWLESASSLASAAAWWTPAMTLTGGGEPERVQGALTTASLFEVLRAAPALGRAYGPEDDRPGAPTVVVLGDGLWRRRFGGDPALLGQSLILDGRPATVIGVMPPGFGFPSPRTELYVPLRSPRERDPVMGTPWRGFRIVNVVARLADGVAVAGARAEVAGVAERLEQAHPDSNAGWGVELVPFLDDVVGDVRAGLLALLAAVALVLVVACANISGLLLARVQRRSRELAIRAALGASSGRLIRQLLTESLLLAGTGGALGVGLAHLGLGALRAARPEGLPRIEGLALDARVLGFALLVTLAAALASGLLPALRAASGDLQPRLRFGSSGSAPGPADVRSRRALVVVELALTVTLLVGAGLLVRSLSRLLAIDPGFSTDRVDAVALVELPRSRYRDPLRAAAFFEELTRTLEATPGVEAAGLSLGIPLDPQAGFFVAQTPFGLPGRAPLDPAHRPGAPLQVVSPGFFEALSIPVVRGRAFDARDRRDRPAVALVNEAFVRRYLAGADPIGQRLVHELVMTEGESGEREIVGVVGDVRYYDLESEAPPQIYVPHLQVPWPAAHVVVRGRGGPRPLGAALRRAVSDLDPEVPIGRPAPLGAIAATAVAAPRLRAELLGGFGTLALLLAALGLYGVLAFGVSARAREIGVRVALGARRGDVVALIVREGMGLAAVGLALGLVAAAGLSRLVAGLLYATAVLDPVAWVGAPLLLAAVALVASFIPAWRAASLDPLRGIRADG